VEDKRRVLIAELTAREGCEAEVRSTLADYAVHVRAEPGNEVFQCYQTEDAPQLFVVYEIYSDEAAFQAHLAAPMNKEVNQGCAVTLCAFYLSAILAIRLAHNSDTVLLTLTAASARNGTDAISGLKSIPPSNPINPAPISVAVKIPQKIPTASARYLAVFTVAYFETADVSLAIPVSVANSFF